MWHTPMQTKSENVTFDENWERKCREKILRFDSTVINLSTNFKLHLPKSYPAFDGGDDDDSDDSLIWSMLCFFTISCACICMCVCVRLCCDNVCMQYRFIYLHTNKWKIFASPRLYVCMYVLYVLHTTLCNNVLVIDAHLNTTYCTWN